MRRISAGLKGRCPRCFLTTRWCICPEQREVRTPLAVDVLMHHRERFRPTSTGNLIGRILPESRLHLWGPERRLTVGDVQRPGRELWILHPQGQPAPAGVAPEQVQVLLLDGVWNETSAMAQEIVGWGRPVRLPMTGASRYWLRAQQDEGRFSTVEALLFLLRMFGLEEAHATLQLQFELHVYASLRVRGHKERAEEFLRGSPAAEHFAAFLAQLHVKRPLEPRI